MKDFLSLRICKELKTRDSKQKNVYYSNIEKAVEIAEIALAETKIVFSGYTEHGITHSYNVAKYMDDIIGNNISSISSLELYIIILCALLHDFGMIVSEAEKKEIIEGKKTILRYGSFNKVKEFIANGDELIALQYIVRKAHGERVSKNIDVVFKDNKSIFRDSNGNPIFNLLTLICESHQRGTDYLVEKFSSNYQLADQVDALYIAALLRIADLLDLNSNRAPDNLYKILRISEDPNKKEHWLKNMSIFSGEKIEKSDFSIKCCSCKNYQRKICLYGYTYEEFVNNYGSISIKDFDKIQCEILDYKNYIEKEVAMCNEVLFKHSDKYHQLYLSNSVKYLIHGNYRKPNFKIDMNYYTIVDLLLGRSIYGDSRIGLREIIQNSMDACKYKVASLDINELESYNPTIIIEYKKKGENLDYDTIEIYDTGIGMDKGIIENYFLNIGKSLYMSDEYKVSNNRFQNAGCYGIGFFSTFMLSESVEVYSKLLGTNDTWHVTIEKGNRYACIEKSNLNVNGTIISLNYNDFKKSFPTVEDVKFYIESNFLSDINDEKKVTIKIRKDGNTENVNLLSIKDILNNDKKKEKIELSKYLDGIDCQMTIRNEEKARWFKFCVENGKGCFKECSYTELKEYKEITYIKLFFDNSFLFVPPDLISDPFMYNGDRQRAFNIVTEKILREYDYTLQDFLDDNGFEYPDRDEIPPAYIGKFYIESRHDDVYFIRKNVSINDPEPNGGILLVGESYYDTVYVRNVRIPKYNIKITNMIYMANDIILPKISKMLINVFKEGINPILNRSDMEEKDKIAVSYAIGNAIISYYCENTYAPSTMKELLKELYKDYNKFIKS